MASLAAIESKEKFTLFCDHSGSLPRRQPGAMTIGHSPVWQRYGCLACRLVWTQEVIVSAAVLGAGVGSAIGGWFSDTVGRRKALLVGDVLFTLGALLMAAAGSPNALIAGQIASVPKQAMNTSITFWSTKSADP